MNSQELADKRSRGLWGNSDFIDLSFVEKSRVILYLLNGQCRFIHLDKGLIVKMKLEDIKSNKKSTKFTDEYITFRHYAVSTVKKFLHSIGSKKFLKMKTLYDAEFFTPQLVVLQKENPKKFNEDYLKRTEKYKDSVQ